jgi:hypothetical protein
MSCDQRGRAIITRHDLEGTVLSTVTTKSQAVKQPGMPCCNALPVTVSYNTPGFCKSVFHPALPTITATMSTFHRSIELFDGDKYELVLLNPALPTLSPVRWHLLYCPRSTTHYSISCRVDSNHFPLDWLQHIT